MATAAWPLQVAIVEKLRAHAPLTDLVTGIYDDVPDTAPFPYVSLGSIVEFEEDSHTQRGLNVSAVLHIWSSYPGNKETSAILSAVCDALDRQPLTVPGWTDVSIAMSQANTSSDPNPDIRHMNATFRVWLTKE